MNTTLLVERVLGWIVAGVLIAWLMKRLWTPKRTHQALGLPRPIAARVLAALEPLEEDTPSELAEEIRADAQDVFWDCLRERAVPDGVYELVIAQGIDEHRVRRRQDARSWSLAEFDDFIDLGLKPHGAEPTNRDLGSLSD